MEQRIEKIERRVETLERLERKLDFDARDVKYKADLAQAMQQVLHNDVQEVKSGLLKVEEDVEYLKLKSDEHGEMLRQILGLLKPEK